MTRAELDSAVQNIMAQLPQAHVHLPRDDEDYAVDSRPAQFAQAGCPHGNQRQTDRG